MDLQMDLDSKNWELYQEAINTDMQDIDNDTDKQQELGDTHHDTFDNSRKVLHHSNSNVFMNKTKDSKEQLSPDRASPGLTFSNKNMKKQFTKILNDAKQLSDGDESPTHENEINFPYLKGYANTCNNRKQHKIIRADHQIQF